MNKIRKRPRPKKWPEPPHYGDDVNPIGLRMTEDSRVWWVYDARRADGEDYRFLAICGDDRTWLGRHEFCKAKDSFLSIGMGQNINERITG